MALAVHRLQFHQRQSARISNHRAIGGYAGSALAQPLYLFDRLRVQLVCGGVFAVCPQARYQAGCGVGRCACRGTGDNVEIVAKKVLELMSITDWINLTAKQGIRLNGCGTELEISPKGILGFTDGQFLVHADDHATNAPQSRCRC
uniref:DUF2345 domain-containing protein n=1 Tax=Burkholderia diffusa TaxID=488732 RepID=UPI001CC63EB5